MLVFKSLNGLAPISVSDLLSIHNPGRSLRSSNQRLLNVPRVRLKTRGDRAFAVAAPKLWNSLFLLEPPLHYMSLKLNSKPFENLIFLWLIIVADLCGVWYVLCFCPVFYVVNGVISNVMCNNVQHLGQQPLFLVVLYK